MSVVKIDVEKCDTQCPFYQHIIGYVDCKHPYWLDRSPCDTLTSTFDHHIVHIQRHNGIPKKCPLRQDKIIQIIKLK